MVAAEEHHPASRGGRRRRPARLAWPGAAPAEPCGGRRGRALSPLAASAAVSSNEVAPAMWSWPGRGAGRGLALAGPQGGRPPRAARLGPGARLWSPRGAAQAFAHRGHPPCVTGSPRPAASHPGDTTVVAARRGGGRCRATSHPCPGCCCSCTLLAPASQTRWPNLGLCAEGAAVASRW